MVLKDFTCKWSWKNLMVFKKNISRPLSSSKTIHQLTSFKTTAFFPHHLSCKFFQDYLFFQDHLSFDIFQDHSQVNFFKTIDFFLRPFIIWLQDHWVVSKAFIIWILSRPLDFFQLTPFKTIGFFQEHSSIGFCALHL